MSESETAGVGQPRRFFDILSLRIFILNGEGENHGAKASRSSHYRNGYDVYFYRLTAGQFADTKRMVLLR
ncbi:MAG: hypothetical protein ACE5OR_05005 [bacterium]